MVTSWKPKQLESCGVCELANSGKSLKVTVDDLEVYVSIKDTENVISGHKPNAAVVRLVEVEEPDSLSGDPQSTLTPMVRQQARHEVYELNRQK